MLIEIARRARFSKFRLVPKTLHFKDENHEVRSYNSGPPSDWRAIPARLAVYLLCFFDYGIRDYAAPMLGIILFLSATCITRQSLAIFRKFMPLWLIVTVYITISYAHWFPRAWTTIYRPDAILRQAMWCFTLPFSAVLGYTYATQSLWRHATREYFIIFVLLCANFLVSGILISDWTYSIWSYGPFGYLWAPFSVYLMVSAWGCFALPGYLIRCTFISLAIPAAMLAESSQTLLAYVCAIVVILMAGNRTWPAKLMMWATVIAASAGYALAWVSPATVAAEDPNAAVRGLMIKSAFEAFRTSDFLGVGFGTEGVKNVYPEIGVSSFNTIDDQFVFIAPHNAFFDVLMRMGLLGLVALFIVILGLSAPTGPNNRAAAFRTLMLTLVLLNLSVNVGLQSPFHMWGVGVMLGASYALTVVKRRRNNASRLLSAILPGRQSSIPAPSETRL